MLISILLTSAALADCMPLSLDEVSEQVRVLMGQAEPGLALQKVNEAIESLPCRTELIRAEDLSELYQVGGTAARQAGDEARWRELYGRAAGMVFPVEFYGVLGDVDRQLYDDLLATQPQPRTAYLTVQGPVFVDGYPLQAGRDQGVPPGDHVVQELLPDGTRTSRLLTLADGQRAELGTPPPRHYRGGQVLVGGALAALGTAGMVSAVYLPSYFSDQYGAQSDEARDRQSKLVTGLTWGSAGITTLGITGLILMTADGPGLIFQGRF